MAAMRYGKKIIFMKIIIYKFLFLWNISRKFHDLWNQTGKVSYLLEAKNRDIDN